MVETFQAVYENGVLRPLAPLDLKEQELVSLAVVRAPAQRDTAVVDEEPCPPRHRDLLVAFVKRMEAMDDKPASDGLTNRDHDRLIYGH